MSEMIYFPTMHINQLIILWFVALASSHWYVGARDDRCFRSHPMLRRIHFFVVLDLRLPAFLAVFVFVLVAYRFLALTVHIDLFFLLRCF